MSSAARWKHHEREVARLLGGRRLPNIGASQADVITDDLAIQVKTRKTVPAWLHSALDQAERDAAGGRMPVEVLCEANRGRKTRRLLVIDLELVHEAACENLMNSVKDRERS